jgi:hypothetical protein
VRYCAPCCPGVFLELRSINGKWDLTGNFRVCKFHRRSSNEELMELSNKGSHRSPDEKHFSLRVPCKVHLSGFSCLKRCSRVQLMLVTGSLRKTPTSWPMSPYSYGNVTACQLSCRGACRGATTLSIFFDFSSKLL